MSNDNPNDDFNTDDLGPSFTDVSDLDTSALGDVNPELLDAKFEAPSRGFAPIPAGNYRLTFPETIGAKVETSRSGDRYLVFDLGANGLTIGPEDIDGNPEKFAGRRFIDAGFGKGCTITTETHKGKGTNDVWDLMVAEGAATREAMPSADDYKTFMIGMQGRTTTSGIRVEPGAVYQGALPLTIIYPNGVEEPVGKRASKKVSNSGYVNLYGSAFVDAAGVLHDSIKVVDVNNKVHAGRDGGGIKPRFKVQDGLGRGWFGRTAPAPGQAF